MNRAIRFMGTAAGVVLLAVVVVLWIWLTIGLDAAWRATLVLTGLRNEAIEGGTWKIIDDGFGNAVQIFYDATNNEVLRVALYKKRRSASTVYRNNNDVTERRKL